MVVVVGGGNAARQPGCMESAQGTQTGEEQSGSGWGRGEEEAQHDMPRVWCKIGSSRKVRRTSEVAGAVLTAR